MDANETLNDQLSERQKRILCLKHQHGECRGMTIAELALHENTSESTITREIARAYLLIQTRHMAGLPNHFDFLYEDVTEKV
jgi:DeoR/GlpR family transcriptional regulator of sugar metabolism